MGELASRVRSGKFSDVRTDIAEIFGADVTDEREYDSLVANAALAQKDLLGGGVLSDKDIELLTSTAGGRQMGGKALDRVVNRLIRNAEGRISEWDDAQAYKANRGNLLGWQPQLDGGMGPINLPRTNTLGGSEAGTQVDLTLKPKSNIPEGATVTRAGTTFVRRQGKWVAQ